MKAFLATMLLVLWFAGTPSGAQADARFQQWLESLWPEAQQMGIARATFVRATRGLEPDFTLPDLDLAGRKPPGQAEFIQPPGNYIAEKTIERLASQARSLAAKYAEPLDAIERQYGVPKNVLLAIWGRETAFGTYRLPHSAVRVLATQAYVGKRKLKFRTEFLLALKILQEGHVTLDEMKSSWAGAMGLTQFLPSEFFKYAVDFDGDGKRDIWRSVPDALAAAAGQLRAKGWQAGQRWAYEVRAPQNADCSIGVPEIRRPLRDWIRAGFVPFERRKLSERELSQEASLLQPEGIYGPSFLTLANYYVIKEYNFSDLYVLFVGHLADAIAEPRPFHTPWSTLPPMKTADVEKMQRNLAARGFYHDKIDGKAGMLTRAALGRYQKENGLKLDCWPTAAVLHSMRTR